jgi:hypothetical protein
MADPDTGRFAAADSYAPATPDERRESQVLMEALAARKDALGGSAQLPPEDRALSERILAEARRRSEQLSLSRNPETAVRTSVQDERIPVWLYLAWAVAIGATVAAWWWLK